MRDGFLKVAAVTPELKVADCVYNRSRMMDEVMEAERAGVKFLVFPEFSLTGYTCHDLFLQDSLEEGALRELLAFAEQTKECDMILIAGLPLSHRGRLYNVAAVLCRGDILGFVPKSHIPNYSEFYEARQFAPWQGENAAYEMPDGSSVPLGTKLIFAAREMKEFTFAIELCEDLWVPAPPSAQHAMAGACLIANLSASDELTGKAYYRRELVKNQSARTVSAYIYANAGEGESTQDLVFGGHNLIVENGTILGESKPFAREKRVVTEVDLRRLNNERRRLSTFDLTEKDGYLYVPFHLTMQETKLTRHFEQTPFVPAKKERREERCDEILTIQAKGLEKRLLHTGCKHAVIGLSGGLDSTLALLVTVRAFEGIGLDTNGIECVTMPCFGTTDRTYNNAVMLAKECGANLREIPIKDSVMMHFQDIGHDKNVHDITYENGQARERTQILMDIANQCGGMVIGTGDMSELALGWATYNGDHMSMYGVNCSVPKTLVRYLVQYYADTCSRETLKNVLYDVLNTPVSPELLPPKDGKISQKTEDIVGPYELHDFFLYYVLRFGFTPEKIFRLAMTAFDGRYDGQTVYRWLHTFYHRFFRQQFKRSCLPDGPKVGTVSVSPRGDLRMPSDASDTLWKEGLDRIYQSLV